MKTTPGDDKRGEWKYTLDQIASAEGWGDPKHDFWFIGMEPGGDWASSWSPERQKYIPYNGKKKIRTPTWQIAAKIVAGLKGENWRQTWLQYWKTLDQHVYWDNALPLPRKAYGLVDGQFKEALEKLGFKTNEQYIEALREPRKQHFQTLLSSKTDLRVVCFGGLLHDLQAEMLGVTSQLTVVGQNIKYARDGNRRFVFTPFLSNCTINDTPRRAHIDEIIAALSK